MRRLYTLSTIFILSLFKPENSQALVRVKALGASPRGQFVALEEYGYKSGNKYPFSKIRVMNVWQNKYVESGVHIIGAQESEDLSSIRKKAKDMVQQKLKKFNISM